MHFLFPIAALAVLAIGFVVAVGRTRASKRLHFDLLENVLRCSGQFFDATPIGRITNRFSKDIDGIDVTIPETVKGFLMTSLHCLATFVIISYSTYIFLVVMLPLGILYYFVQVHDVTMHETSVIVVSFGSALSSLCAAF